MKKAFIHLANGFEEIEALTIVDVLRRAGVPSKMVSVTGKRVVIGAHDIAVKADVLFEEADYEEAEILILPGGMPGAKNLDNHKGLQEKLKSFSTSGKKLAAICAAPLVFGHLGLLNKKKASCYPGFEKELAGAEVSYDAVSVADNITTSRGPGTALDFALTLVEQLKGKEKADELARGMLVQTW
jgi:4-methyl-5(b-hydroxyethyl)-thiazole monophosphate biosynthesis